MMTRMWNRRQFAALGVSALLAGCQVIPSSGRVEPVRPAPPPPTTTVPAPGSTLPQDGTRHRIALLVPLTGNSAAVGQSIANAANMAVLDTSADNIRITTYDTGTDPGSAAARAIADGNAVILGPLNAGDVPSVSAAARPAGVPVIAFTNDMTAARGDVFVMGQMPEQSIRRTVGHARAQGVTRFAALIPQSDYGQRAEAAFGAAVRDSGGTLVAVERFGPGTTEVAAATARLRRAGGFEAVLIPESSRTAAQAAAAIKPSTAASPRILGTELWSGAADVPRAAALRGAWFSAMSDARYRRFSDTYRTRHGAAPYRVSTIGYDAVLLVLRLAQDWRPGRPFPLAALRSDEGFLGLDGPFRFGRDGVIERTMEVREVRTGTVTIIDPAPQRF